MPGGDPVVTAPCGVHEAPQLCSWLDSAPPWEAGTSAQPQLGDAISPSPPLPTPAGQMSPSPRPTVLQGYKTSAANMVGNKPGFPLLAYSRSLRKPAPQVRVSSEA